MSSSYYHKPEQALRRAQELQSIGQPTSALTLLHDVLSSRRHKTWSPTYENIMMTYLNLCLSLNRAREAKDGLHQYRNLSQSQAPGSLEKVIRYLIEQAEKKCRDAKNRADEAGAAASSQDQFGADEAAADDEADDDVDDDDDLTSSATQQSILLSTMSIDPDKAQRDSALLLPSLKFLWETYRAVLDILKSNSKLERLYHSAALGALNFCKVYKRRTEFRRLCDMLRMHLGNLQKYGSGVGFEDGVKPNSKVRGWEGWTTESIELHLQTRFAQLETASVLHLYTEGFRTVEDIYNILQISHSRRKIAGATAPPPKAKLMAAYYEKLTTLFWVSENYLFHAFAWYKYYTLCREYNRSMSPEIKKMQASAVLLSALCIPAVKEPATKKSSDARHSITSTVEDDIAKEKMARMATLLGFHTRSPSREVLLTEIRTKNVMDDVPDYLRELYTLLEENSDPLIMVDRARPLLERLRKEVGATTGSTYEEENEDVEDTTLGRYVKPLTSVLLLKLLLNLSAAYHTVSLDNIKNLTSGLGVTFEQVEKAIVLSTQSKTLSVRIDHRAGCLRFGDSALESDAMRSQLTVLSKQLASVCKIISPPDESRRNAARLVLYDAVRSSLEVEHAAVLERKVTIEKRKEEVERLAQEKIKEEMRIKEAKEAARKAGEERRQVIAKQMREREKMREIEKKLEEQRKIDLLKVMGKNTEEMTQEEIEKLDARALAKEHADKASKKKEEAERKLREAAKRHDYIVRAVRIEEKPLVQRKWNQKIKRDKERYEAEVVERAKHARAQWEEDVKDKAKFEEHSVFAYMAEFEKMVMKGRKIIHERRCKEEDVRAELEAEKSKLARARKRKEDEKRRIAEEESRRIAEEEERKKEEERRKREEERRKKEEEAEKRRQAELARMQEERDRKERERQEAMRPPPSRDLEGGSTGGKYVPPALRNKASAAGPGPDRGAGLYAGPGSRDRWGGGRYEGPGSREKFGDRGVGSGRFAGLSDRDGDRPRFGGGDRDGDRPRFGASDRDGDRPRFGGSDRDGDRPRFGGGDRDRRDGPGSRGPPPEPRNSRWS